MKGTSVNCKKGMGIMLQTWLECIVYLNENNFLESFTMYSEYILIKIKTLTVEINL